MAAVREEEKPDAGGIQPRVLPTSKLLALNALAAATLYQLSRRPPYPPRPP